MRTLKIEIVFDHGLFYVNGKRLGHDLLTYAEKEALNNFIKEYKENAEAH